MYQQKYLKYKKKYIKLKSKFNQMNNCVHNYYFVHGTFRFQNLIDILKSGKIYSGKYLQPEQRGLCGMDPGDKGCENIYANIYFEDIDNIESTRSFTLLLHPKIIYEKGFIFSKGWTSRKDIVVSASDTPIEINRKLNEIRDFLKNPSELSEFIQKSSGTYHHEVQFDSPIELDKNNLIGIICENCNNDELKLIKEIIKDKSYDKIKIMTKTSPLPKLEKIIN
ncbi:hypothetical protein QLL95_gp0361 [Cotonvirus japonicus]|uniref:Gamma-glutamylcyclotransferase AIG2-like domain-containing protein n=1 Tax=Cotonvirus japonicus TaxID=2811091 RepID=A0ABM7NUA8_9VIRU|nr:hypothetical protein QLL95_gp0004 [Cotonvirus japonicus]YP_010842370.1 hypothetical protein QLL95_gp0361 [Cotonvirus japonicus]BCS82493.1 hypothetical protein [Cotonvirus japonicus]BCS83762.1 hypothetical protein [Cotonvirus japonicus]